MARGKGKTATRGVKKGGRGGAAASKMSKNEAKKSKKSIVDTLKVQNGVSDSSESHQSSQDEMSNDSEASENLQVSPVKSKKTKKAEKKKIEKVKNVPNKTKSDSDDSESDSDEEPKLKNVKPAHVQKINQKTADSDSESENEQDSMDEININNQVEVDSDDEENGGNNEQNEEDEEDNEDDEEKPQEESESSEEVLPKKIPNKMKKVEVPQKQQQTSAQSKNNDENPPSTRVFIANLSKDANSEAIQEFFTAHDLQTVDLYIPGSDKFHKGFAFAEFEDIETATRAIQLSGENISGSPVDITYARPKKNDQGDRRNDSFKQRGGFQRSGYGGGHGNSGPTSIIFVKNLPTGTTENDLKKHFKGSQEVRMMKNQDGSCRGHAYIEYDSQNSAKNAKESLAGVEIGGSRVVLDYAQPRGQGRDEGFRRDSFRGGRDRGGFRGGRFQRGGRDFGGRGGFGNRGGFGGVGKARGGFNRGGPSGKRIQFNDDDD